MWTHSPEAALQIAAELHRERIARAEQFRLVRRGRESRRSAARRPRHQPFSQFVTGTGRVAAALARTSTHRPSGVSTPCPTGAC